MRSPALLLALALAAAGAPAAPAAEDPAPPAPPVPPAPAGKPPEEKPRDVAALLRPIRERNGVPALGGALVHGERVTALGADGVRRRGSKEPVTAGDLWHLGSCTKAMTATLCGLLVEEGKIAWDARLADSLPELAKAMDPGWKECTLEMLLQHRGGAASDLSPEGLRDRLWQFRGPPEEGRVLLAKGLFGRPPLSPPGAKFLYANASYALAGAMAERATNKPVEALLRERVFGPLGMRSAAFGAPGAADRLDQPRGHTEAGVPVEPGPAADNPAPMAPAGGVHATLEDWARFVGLHARGEKRPSLLKAETFRRLHAPASSIGSTYAMGWDVTKRGWGGGDGRVLVHTGSNTMWFCVAWIAPEREFGVLAVCNQGGDAGAKACDEAAWALIQDHLAHEGAAAAK